jgi:hypothetical protein
LNSWASDYAERGIKPVISVTGKCYIAARDMNWKYFMSAVTVSAGTFIVILAGIHFGVFCSISSRAAIHRLYRSFAERWKLDKLELAGSRISPPRLSGL